MGIVNKMAAGGISNAVLKVSDGTSTVNLLHLADGYHVAGWRQAVASYKGGGTWSQSALADGRRLVNKQFANSTERYPIPVAKSSDADAQARAVQDLLRLCEKASDYWKDTWRTEPVWIEVRADCETESRYATLHTAGLPELGDFYSFEYLKDAVMQGMTLVVERNHWHSQPPGESDCVQAEGRFTYRGPYYLVFNGVDADVNCGSDPNLDDLHDAAMTIEAWVRETGEGSALRSFIATKGDFAASDGWALFTSIAAAPEEGLVGIVFCAGGPDAARASGYDDWSIADGEWHHVAMTWDDATMNDIRLWIDGVEPTYAVTTTRVGAIVTDAGDDFMIGSVSPVGGQEYEGDMGWMRVSDSVRYTATFTPPVRCNLPTIDGNTVALWIDRGSGATIFNREGTAALNGTAANTTWDNDCPTAQPTEGRAATCDDEVYLANKQNMARLTNIFQADGAVLTELLGTAFPQSLFPAVPLANDAVYFGASTLATVDSGPFCSLVFDIATAAVYVPVAQTAIWEYWNGAWVALTVQDNTASGADDPFSVTGVNSVHWVQPSDWVTTNDTTAITGWWVRCRINAGNPTTATQQVRDVYTITWPYVEIDEDEVGGDLSALAQILLTNQSDDAGNTYTSRAVCGLRSVSRGFDFAPFLNCANDGPTGSQNANGIVVSYDATVSDIEKASSVTGAYARYNPVGVEAMAMRVQFAMDNRIASQYVGRFHGYVRASQPNGSVGDFSVRVVTKFGAGFQEWVSESAATYVLNQWQVLDVGTVLMPAPGEILSDKTFDAIIQIQASASNAAADLYIYDLVLIPVDEWAGDFRDSDEAGSGAAAGNADKIDIDSVLMPRASIRSTVENGVTGYTDAVWLPVTNGPAQLQQKEDHRLHFFFSRYHDPGAGIIESSEPWISHSIQVFKVQRYLGMRGAR